MNLKKSLQDSIPPEELPRLIRGFDIIGDIAVVIIAEGFDHYEQLIAEAIAAAHKNVKTVLKRAGTYSGEFRTIPLTFIAGERKTETVCSEYEIRLWLDLAKLYFSIRSGHERKRIADLVKPGENVLVMFSGIAPYPLMIAKFSSAEKITGIEINRAAHDYALQNLKLNKARNISLIHGDVCGAVKRSAECYDRIVMPLPGHAGEFLETALRVLKPGGAVHFYDFKIRGSFETSSELISAKAQQLGRRINASNTVVCGHSSPQRFRICVDATIS